MFTFPQRSGSPLDECQREGSSIAGRHLTMSSVYCSTPRRYRRVQENATFSLRRRSRSLDEVRPIFITMNRAEKELVKDSWENRRRDDPSSLIGRALLVIRPIEAQSSHVLLSAWLKIIGQTPKRYWSSLGVGPEDNDATLRRSPKLRAHLMRCELFLTSVIELLNTKREFACGELIASLGRRHTHFAIHFDAPTWLAVKRSIVESVCEGESSAALVNAWTKFVGHILSEMRKAFNRETSLKLTKRPDGEGVLT